MAERSTLHHDPEGPVNDVTAPRSGVSWTAIARGALAALVVIVPISILIEVLERRIDDLEGNPWLFVPFLGVLAAYVTGGAVAGRLARDSALVNGALAALCGLLGWLVVPIVVRLARGDDLDLGAKAVIVNALFALAFGMFGAAVFTRAEHEPEPAPAPTDTGSDPADSPAP